MQPTGTGGKDGSAKPSFPFLSDSATVGPMDRLPSPWLDAVFAAFFLALSAAAQDHLVRETEALPPEGELAALSVPEGFSIELFAAEPMINKPINLAVDPRGRVWVSSTVEYPYAAAKERWSDPLGARVRESRDAIKILEDLDGDGRADRAIDFADGLNIPTGVLPWHRPEHRDGCIAWSIPNLWYFADTDGDGRADHREVLFGPLGYEKDTHGMVSSLRLGPDGWIYATHGFNNSSVVRAKDGGEIELHSGNVFRFRPDASRVEVWSRGQVNPFGLAFDRRGNLYSADCHSAPVYQLLRGAHYPSFGKPHDGLGFGPAMIEHTHGSTGIAGIAFVDRGIWGADWDDHVLIGNPVTSRVNLDRIRFDGTTPRAEERPDFVVSEDPWFRPVDLCLAPDGALYLADFYNRIIGHYEVPLDHPGRDRERGRIWRIVRTAGAGEAEKFEPPPPPADPVAALASPGPWERRRAAAALLETPASEAIGPLRRALAETPSEDTHLRQALRIALRDCLALPGALTDLEGGVDAHFVEIVLAVSGAEASSWLLGLSDGAELPPDFAARRRHHVARNGDAEVVSELVSREVGEGSDDEPERGLALLEIAETLEERFGPLRDALVIGEASKIAESLLERRESGPGSDWRVAEGSPGGWAAQGRRTDASERVEVLSSLASGTKSPERHVGRLVSREFAMPARLAFRLCGHLGPPSTVANVKNYVVLVDAADGRELARAEPPRSDVAVLVEWCFPEWVGRRVRLEAIDGDDGRAYAWLALGAVEGVELPTEGFARAAREEEMLRRFARLLAPSAPVALRDRLAPYLPPAPPAPPLDIAPEERARLDALVAARVAAYDPGAADAERGRQVFAAHCAACHRLGGEGGLVGPQLDGVGTRGLARLAEDILDPSRNVDAHFRLTVLRKKDGSAVGGFVAGESEEVVHLLDASGQAHRVLMAEVAARETTALSLMPAVFGEAIAPAEFADLLAWLLVAP